jgi:hypothetical protein
MAEISLLSKLLRRGSVLVLASLVLGCSADGADGGSGGRDDAGEGGNDDDDRGDDDDDDDDDDGPEVEDVEEDEPNDGPTYDDFQALGTFDGSKTIRVEGELSSGGNDGSQYTGDFDVFAFTVEDDGGTLSIDLDWEGGADVDVVLYDDDLRPLTADGESSKPIASSGPIPAGRYALAMFSKDDAAEWSLSLAYSVGGGGEGGSCVSPLQESPGGGCSFTMNEPAQNGASISLPYTFGWRSDGCETPGKVYFYGNPPTENNWISVEYTRGGQESLLNVTGDYMLTDADLAQLSSDDGVYHWQLESWHGYRSPAWTFTVGGEACR